MTAVIKQAHTANHYIVFETDFVSGVAVYRVAKCIDYHDGTAREERSTSTIKRKTALATYYRWRREAEQEDK